MDVLDKIRAYRVERGWTEYQLAEKSNIPQSTISSWYRKKQIPTIPSLEKICAAFNITLAQFFSEEHQNINLTKVQTEMLHQWNRLNTAQQTALLNLLKLL